MQWPRYRPYSNKPIIGLIRETLMPITSEHQVVIRPSNAYSRQFLPIAR